LRGRPANNQGEKGWAFVHPFSLPNDINSKILWEGDVQVVDVIQILYPMIASLNFPLDFLILTATTLYSGHLASES